MVFILSDSLQFTLQCNHTYWIRNKVSYGFVMLTLILCFETRLKFLTFYGLIRFHGRIWCFFLLQFGQLNFDQGFLDVLHVTKFICFFYQNTAENENPIHYLILFNTENALSSQKNIPWYRTSTETIIGIVVSVIDLMVQVLQNGLVDFGKLKL